MRWAAIIYDPADPFAQDRLPDDSRFALDHFSTKLLRLPEGMLTATGRVIAQERVATMMRFLEVLAREIDAAPPAHWAGT